MRTTCSITDRFDSANAAHRHPSRAEQYVEFPEALDGCLDCPSALLGVGTSVARPAPPRRGPSRRARHAQCRLVRAASAMTGRMPGQSKGRGPADAGRTSGDENDLVLNRSWCCHRVYKAEVSVSERQTLSPRGVKCESLGRAPCRTCVDCQLRTAPKKS